jgi:hypothetical protein
MSELNISPMVKVLTDAGFPTGWALQGDVLILWEHEAEPPKPLKRPEA